MEFIIIGVFLAFLTGVFFYKCLFLGLVLVPADILTYFYPWKLLGIYPKSPHNPFLGDGILGYYPLVSFVSEVFKKGIMPLWNPYLYCGTPLLASNDAFVFSPVILLASFMPVYKAITLYIILQIFFSGFFMYLFLRKGLNLSKFSSLAGSAVFMFNGHFVVWLNHIGFVGVLMWLPLIFLLLEKMVVKKRIVYAFLTGLILGLQFYCGFLQVSYYLLLGSGLYGLIRIFQEYFKNKRLFFVSLSYLGLVFIIGLGIGAVQLLPSLELLTLSYRQAEAIPFNLFNPACLLALITFIFPDIFGNPIHNNYWGPPNYVELCGYVGIIPLILLFVAAGNILKDKRVFALSALALFSLGVYLQTPLNSLLYFLPGYNRNLSAVRIVCLYVFSASCLAGLGLEYVRKLKESSLAGVQRNIFVCFLTILSLYLAGNFLIQTNKDYILKKAGEIASASLPKELASKPDFNIVKQTFFVVFGSDWDGYLRYFYHILRPSLSLSLSLSLFTIFLLDLYVKKKKEALARLLLFFFIAIDLFYFGMRFYAVARPSLIFPHLECVDFLKKDKSLFRVFTVGDTFVPNTLMAYGIQSEGGYLSLFSGRYEEFWELINKKSPSFTYRLTDYNSRLFNLLNVRYFIGARKDEVDGNFKNFKFEPAYARGELRIYQNKDCLERAFFVRDFKVIRKKKDILSYLGSAGFEPGKTIVLEEEPQGISADDASVPGASAINILDYGASSVLIEVNAASNGFLVLADSFYPGWKALVDGKKDKIYCADYIFRAVYLKKGRHKVRFGYEPLSFRIGLFLALAAFTAILIIPGIKLKKRCLA